MVKSRRARSGKILVADKELLKTVYLLKAEHPFWGYRRIWAYLKFVEGLTINKKRVYRLLKENNLLVKRDLELKARRTHWQSKPRASRANQWWGVDMTKVMTNTGWAYIVLVVDWYTKKIVGHFCGEQSKSWHWLAALNKAVNRQFPYDSRIRRRIEFDER